jgi:ketosteroid isomerase-like protein
MWLVGLMLLASFGAAAQDAGAKTPAAASPQTRQWFQTVEQALMNSIGPGDKSVWDRVMDPSCVVTSEEGQVMTRQQFLDQLSPLPQGLTGGIAVKDLTVQEFPTFAVVRYLADEWESVFGQKLTTQYRVTDTFRRDGDDWKIVASHLAVVTRDPPAQIVSNTGWPSFVGTYRLLPDGWTFTVELRGGRLYGGRDPKKLRPFIPLTPDAFVLSGRLGEWLFVSQPGEAARIVTIRKFEPLVWTRIGPSGHQEAGDR